MNFLCDNTGAIALARRLTSHESPNIYLEVTERVTGRSAILPLMIIKSTLSHSLNMRVM